MCTTPEASLHATPALKRHRQRNQLGSCCAADFGVQQGSIVKITNDIYNLTVAYDPGVVFVGDQVVVSGKPPNPCGTAAAPCQTACGLCA